MLYDLFICHAFEDKTAVVRPLAEALVGCDLAVWYDEYALSIGDSLRQSIDRGLKESRFGVVVLSPAFFAKQWTQYELDGIVNREIIARQRMLLPVWHNVTAEEVASHSPALAGRFAARTGDGIDAVVDAILKVARPRASPLVVARKELLEWGLTPPVIQNEYWLDVVEASNRVPAIGAAVPEQSTWGRWSFPLPQADGTPEGRGVRLAWTAMQLAWTADADSRPVDLTTHPDEVWRFVERHPGLRATCEDFPELVAEYAPQVTIRGFGGPLEELFESLYQTSLQIAPSAPRGRRGAAASDWALRDAVLGGLSAEALAYDYFSGGIFGPEVRLHEGADYLFWLLAEESTWLPAPIRSALLEGVSRNKGLWLWLGSHVSGRAEWPREGCLAEAIYKASQVRSDTIEWNEGVRADVSGRAAKAANNLSLAADPESLAARFREANVVGLALESDWRRREKDSSVSDD